MESVTIERERIDALISEGDSGMAYALLSGLWRQGRSPALAGFVASRFEKLAEALSLTHCRVFFLRSFTLEPVLPLLQAEAAAAGLRIVAGVGDFNAYAQEMLDPGSRLYAFCPDVVILAVQTRDIAPELWEGFADLTVDQVSAAVERVEGEFAGWIGAFRSHSDAHLVVHLLEVPPAAAGLLDSQTEVSQVQVVRELNERLRRHARRCRSVHVLDYDELVSRHGRMVWHDERKWQSVRLPISSGCLAHLAEEWMRYLHPLTGKTCKVLVTDLDNTLWGGVVGEDGLDGICLDTEYPGAGYHNLQRAILDLYRRGIILAICSKNNASDALEALESHPYMLLRPGHFASLKINWQDKATNLREMARELNLGLEAFAFLDDSKAEREWVQRELPQVRVIDLPDDPSHYADALRACGLFERLSLSAEDRNRGEYYATDRQREELKDRAQSLEEFYASLGMRLILAPVTAETVTRVAQLTQKTNQFNLTTRRYNEQQISAMARDIGWRVYWAKLTDRFGDNGVIAVVIVRVQDRQWDLDTFLMSCRVIGRTVETAILARIVGIAREGGAERICGTFVPTAKNTPIADFFSRHGFTCVDDQQPETRWELDLIRREIASPPWIDSTLLTQKDHS